MAITLPDANDEKCLILFEKVKKELFSYSESINIKNVDQKFFKEIVIPIALYLIGLDKTSKPVLIGLTGGQGSGKTTLSDFVQLTLKKGFNKKTQQWRRIFSNIICSPIASSKQRFLVEQ